MISSGSPIGRDRWRRAAIPSRGWRRPAPRRPPPPRRRRRSPAAGSCGSGSARGWSSTTATSSDSGTSRPSPPWTLSCSSSSTWARWARSRRSTIGTGSRAVGIVGEAGVGAGEGDPQRAHDLLGGDAGADRLLAVDDDLEPRPGAPRPTSRRRRRRRSSSKTSLDLAGDRRAGPRGSARRSRPPGSTAPAGRAGSRSP